MLYSVLFDVNIPRNRKKIEDDMQQISTSSIPCFIHCVETIIAAAQWVRVIS